MGYGVLHVRLKEALWGYWVHNPIERCSLTFFSQILIKGILMFLLMNNLMTLHDQLSFG